MRSIFTILPLLAATVGRARCLTQHTLYNFPQTGAWVENLAVRPNGNLLVTRFDVPELWSIDIATSEATKIATFDSAMQSAGITELSPDVFAVITGNYSLTAGGTAGSWGIHKADFTAGDSSKPAISTIKMLPDAQFLNGLTTVDEDTVLASDMQQGAVYKLTISTGSYRILAQDTSMAPVDTALLPVGIDGVRYHDGYVYFTNIYGQTFNRMPMTAMTIGAAASGLFPNTTGSALLGVDLDVEVEELWSGTFADDFTFDADGNAYVATNAGDSIVKVTPDGEASTVATVAGSTSCVFGRTDADSGVLYVGGDNGAITAVHISS